MDKNSFLFHLTKSGLSEENQKIWREATEFLSPEILTTLGNQIITEANSWEELTQEIKKHKEAILNHV